MRSVEYTPRVDWQCVEWHRADDARVAQERELQAAAQVMTGSTGQPHGPLTTELDWATLARIAGADESRIGDDSMTEQQFGDLVSETMTLARRDWGYWGAAEMVQEQDELIQAAAKAGKFTIPLHYRGMIDQYHSCRVEQGR